MLFYWSTYRGAKAHCWWFIKFPANRITRVPLELLIKAKLKTQYLNKKENEKSPNFI